MQMWNYVFLCSYHGCANANANDDFLRQQNNFWDVAAIVDHSSFFWYLMILLDDKNGTTHYSWCDEMIIFSSKLPFFRCCSLSIHFAGCTPSLSLPLTFSKSKQFNIVIIIIVPYIWLEKGWGQFFLYQHFKLLSLKAQTRSLHFSHKEALSKTCANPYIWLQYLYQITPMQKYDFKIDR